MRSSVFGFSSTICPEFVGVSELELRVPGAKGIRRSFVVVSGTIELRLKLGGKDIGVSAHPNEAI
jgi:hypothetical protein